MRHMWKRLLSLVACAGLLIEMVPSSMYSAAADAVSQAVAGDGGFSLTAEWKETGNSYTTISADGKTLTNTADKDVTVPARLRISYANTELATSGKSYAPGTVVITVNGLGNAGRSSVVKAESVAADDSAAGGTKVNNWSYTYSSATDTYTFVNNNTFYANKPVEGYFEIVWGIPSRTTKDGYTTNVSATLRTSSNEKKTSNTVAYVENYTKDTFSLSLSSEGMYGTDGLTSALPTGAKADDYIWRSYTVYSSFNSRNSLPTQSYGYKLWFPSGTVVQHDGLAKTAETKTVDGTTYEAYLLNYNQQYYGWNDKVINIFAAFPRASYENQASIVVYADMVGTYFEAETQETLAQAQTSIYALTDYQLLPPGYIFSNELHGYGVHSTYINNYDYLSYYYGAIKSIHLADGQGTYYSVMSANMHYNYVADGSAAAKQMAALLFVPMFVEETVEALPESTEAASTSESSSATAAAASAASESTSSVAVSSVAAESSPSEASQAAASSSTQSETASTVSSEAVSSPITGDLTGATPITLSDCKSLDVQYTEDFHDVLTTAGTYRQLADTEYNLTSFIIPGGVTNQNGFPLTADKYVVDVFVRHAGQTSFDTTAVATTKLENTAQSIALPADAVAVRCIVYGMNSSYQGLNFQTGYVFHTTATDIVTDGGDFAVNGYMYYTAHFTDGSTRIINPGAEYNTTEVKYYYDTTMTYADGRTMAQRDIDTYGTYEERYTAHNRILQERSEYYVSADLTATQSSTESYTISGSANVTMDLGEDGSVSTASMYLLLPAEVSLANGDDSSDGIKNNATIIAANFNGAAEVALNEYVTGVTIENNYKGSGRTKVSVHFDFGGPATFTGISLSGLQMFSNMRTTLDQKGSADLTLNAAFFVDSGAGSWFTGNTDNNAGTLNDFDQDGITDEIAAFSYITKTFYKGQQAETSITKLVSTTTSNGFTDGGYSDVTKAFTVVPKAVMGSTYTYRLKMQTASSGSTNIVYVDNLEKYTGSAWQGTFVSVDTSAAAALTGVTPVIYYSQTEVETSNVASINLSNTAVWSTTKPSTVRSIAVDFGSANVAEGKTLSIDVTMTAPSDSANVGKNAINTFAAKYEKTDDKGNITSATPFVLVSNPVAVTLSQPYGNIRLVKKDAVDKSLITGAVFAMYKLTGLNPNTAVDPLVYSNLTTDANGSINVQGIDYGTYYFVETASANAYVLDTTPVTAVLSGTVTGKSTTVTAINQRKPGTVSVTKKDNFGNTLAGASIVLSKADGTVVGTQQTGADGVATFTNLDWGTYTAKETVAPTGYTVNPSGVTVTVGKSAVNAAATIVDEQAPASIELTKYEVLEDGTTQTGNVLEGAAYELYRVADFTEASLASGTLVGTYVTDKNGKIYADSLPFGDYYFAETIPTTGYALNENKITVALTADKLTASADGSYKAVLTTTDTRNKPLVWINKQDTEGQMLSGAKFGLFKVTSTNADGTPKDYFQCDETGAASTKVFTTDAEGNASFTVYWGDYFVKELSAPSGYSGKDDVYQFSVNAETASTDVKVFATNEQILGSIDVLKTSNVDGIVSLDNIQTSGWGTGASSGYANGLTGTVEGTSMWTRTYAGATSINITFDAGSKTESGCDKVSIYDKSGTVLADCNKISGTAMAGKTYTVTGDTAVIKFTSDGSAATAGFMATVKAVNTVITLPGAEFELFKTDGTKVTLQQSTDTEGNTYYEPLTATGAAVIPTSDANGLIHIKNLPWSGYYMQETKAPTGYGVNPDKIRFTVNSLSAGATQMLPVKDPAETYSLTIVKKLPKATVVDAHGDLVFNFNVKKSDSSVQKNVSITLNCADTADADGNISGTATVRGITLGDYTITEQNTNRYEAATTVQNVSIADSTAVVTFANTKYSQNDTSAGGKLSNIVNSARKATAIKATYTGPATLGDNVGTLDATKITAMRLYDDGTSDALATSDYTVSPTTFETAGDYVITVTDNTYGVTDSFTINVPSPPPPFYWTVTDGIYTDASGNTYDGTAAIYQYTGSSSTVAFPSTVIGVRNASGYTANGKKYAVIAINASKEYYPYASVFDGKNVTSMSLPSTITSIGGNAFDGCKGLTGALIIPNSVTSIGSYAFRKCSGLTGALTIPNGVTSIGKSAFEDCIGFTGALTMPNSVTTIGDHTFYGCSGFNGALTIPDGVTSIGDSAFSGCSGLTGALTMPNSVTTIGDYTFYGCSGFNGALTIPDGVTKIGGSAFANCGGFTGTLMIPDGVTSIGDSAFSGCSGLTGALTIPNSVTTIGSWAFYGCSGLTGPLTIGSGVTSIGGWAFDGCKGLTGALTIPNSVTTIGQYAFYYCPGLTGTLTIGSGVTTIGEAVFRGCKGLTGALTIPDGVTSIGDSAFSGCSGLTGALTIPNSVTTIGQYAFYYCSGLTGTLTIGSGVTTIGNNAFSGCSGLTGALIIPDNVTSIGADAFASCSGINSASFPSWCLNDVYYAYGLSLSICTIRNQPTVTSTQSVTINTETYKISELSGTFTAPDGNAYAGVAYLTKSTTTGQLSIPDYITYNSKNYAVVCVGNVVSNNAICSTATGLSIGNNISIINSYAFYNCKKLTGAIVIPNSVTTIRNRAFYNCSGLTGILTIPNSVTTIGQYAFSGCSKITSASFPNWVSADTNKFYGLNSGICTVRSA